MNTRIVSTTAEFSRENKTPNPLADNQVYARVGRNDILESKPSIVHFGGYAIHKTHIHKVRVVNISTSSQRVHILNPETPFFKIKVNKKGLIAPGMAEDIEIQFTPNEYRYYYDKIKIHCQGENILIPLHAYPVMNDVIFPTRIDMGRCSLGETVTRTVALECNVPIEFGFQLHPLQHSPEFHIFPLQGRQDCTNPSA